jgi:hypothetical protein
VCKPSLQISRREPNFACKLGNTGSKFRQTRANRSKRLDERLSFWRYSGYRFLDREIPALGTPEG